MNCSFQVAYIVVLQNSNRWKEGGLDHFDWFFILEFYWLLQFESDEDKRCESNSNLIQPVERKEEDNPALFGCTPWKSAI